MPITYISIFFITAIVKTVKGEPMILRFASVFDYQH